MNNIIYHNTEYRCEASEDKDRYVLISDNNTIPLTAPYNHRHEIDDIKDIAVVNDVICYVYQDKKGLYSLRPAGNGSGMAIDAYCYDINSWGEYGDFLKVKCRICEEEWYVNVRHIPKGDKYESPCPKCGTLLIRKR